MGRTKAGTPPSYCLHKPTGRAYVTFPRPFRGKKTHTLGPHGTRQTSPQSWERYDRLIAEWLLSRHEPQPEPSETPGSITVLRVADLYLVHATATYQKDGRPTGQLPRVRAAVGPLVSLYGSTPAATFGPKSLKAVRAHMVARGWARSYVNSCVGVVKGLFSWAVSEELIPGAVTHALRTVKGLRRGTAGIREAEPVGPVPWADVERTLGELSPVVADMVRVQYLADMRPCEVCGLCPENIDRSGTVAGVGVFPGVWVYEVRDQSNKTAHRGKRRVVFFGQQAQAVLAPYLLRRPAGAAVFSPREAAEWYANSKGRAFRARRQRAPGEEYRTSSYDHAIRSACERAGVSPWAPNRLRHTRASEVRAGYGVEAAQAILGHAHISTAEIYAERDYGRAADVMRAIG